MPKIRHKRRPRLRPEDVLDDAIETVAMAGAMLAKNLADHLVQNLKQATGPALPVRPSAKAPRGIAALSKVQDLHKKPDGTYGV